jgi:outer membrane lipoprotein-sorting protein
MNTKDESEVHEPCEIESRLIALGETLKSRISIEQQVMTRSADLMRDPHAPSAEPKSGFSLEGSNVMRYASICGLAAALLLVFVYWTSDSQVTFAQAMERVQKVTSYSADFSIENRNGAPASRVISSGKFYWQAPDKARSESNMVRTAAGLRSNVRTIEISSRTGKGIRLDVEGKTYVELPPLSGAPSPLNLLETLSRYKTKSTKELGRRTIDGVACTGFEIDINAIDANVGGGVLEVWFDDLKQLPTYVVAHLASQFAPVDVVMSNFQWNQKLESELFAVDHPPGYSPLLPKSPELTDDQLARKVSDALRFYAELNGGKYPQVKTIYGDVTLAKLRELSGINLSNPAELWQNEAQLRAYHRIEDSAVAWEEITRIMKHDSSAQYHGLTVGPEEKDKILLKWRRTDGQHQLIFGDLRLDVAQ